MFNCGWKGSTGFYWVLYWVLLGFTGFYWVFLFHRLATKMNRFRRLGEMGNSSRLVSHWLAPSIHQNPAANDHRDDHFSRRLLSFSHSVSFLLISSSCRRSSWWWSFVLFRVVGFLLISLFRSPFFRYSFVFVCFLIRLHVSQGVAGDELPFSGNYRGPTISKQKIGDIKKKM